MLQSYLNYVNESNHTFYNHQFIDLSIKLFFF